MGLISALFSSLIWVMACPAKPYLAANAFWTRAADGQVTEQFIALEASGLGFSDMVLSRRPVSFLMTWLNTSGASVGEAFTIARISNGHDFTGARR
jgi:hypothetical protein